MNAQIEALVAQCVANGKMDQAVAASQLRSVPGLRLREIRKLALRRARSAWVDGVLQVAKLRIEMAQGVIENLHKQMRELGGFDSDFDKKDEWLRSKRPAAWADLQTCPELRQIRENYFAVKDLKKRLEKNKGVTPEEADQLIVSCVPLQRIDQALRASALGASARGNSFLVVELISDRHKRYNDAAAVARRGVAREVLDALIAACVNAGAVEVAVGVAQMRSASGLTTNELAALTQACSERAQQ